MNDEQRIDNIVERKMRDLGDQMARMYDKELLKQFNGIDLKWFAAKCAKCGISMMNHNKEILHPFFEDNLQYLEWEDAKHNSK